jgi:RimJ/RimL family protein N-acetyltransferase
VDRLPFAVTRPAGPLRTPESPLRGEGLLLDVVTHEDVPAVVAACDDPEAARWLHLPSPYTAADAREWIADSRQAQREGERMELAIRDARDRRYLGAIGVHFGRCRAGEAEIGYLVSPSARGGGVAARAIRLLVPWVLSTYRPRRIELLIRPDNAASCRAAEKAGAAFEGIRAAGIAFRDGAVHDAAVYAFAPDAHYPSAS